MIGMMSSDLLHDGDMLTIQIKADRLRENRNVKVINKALRSVAAVWSRHDVMRACKVFRMWAKTVADEVPAGHVARGCLERLRDGVGLCGISSPLAILAPHVSTSLQLEVTNVVQVAHVQSGDNKWHMATDQDVLYCEAGLEWVAVRKVVNASASVRTCVVDNEVQTELSFDGDVERRMKVANVSGLPVGAVKFMGSKESLRVHSVTLTAYKSDGMYECTRPASQSLLVMGGAGCEWCHR